MSNSGTAMLVFGVILSIIGTIYIIASFATLSGNWFFGVFLGIIGGILIQIGKDKVKKSQIKKIESQQSVSSNSLEILKERYAKGEITKEQFEQMKEDLET